MIRPQFAYGSLTNKAYAPWKQRLEWERRAELTLEEMRSRPGYQGQKAPARPAQGADLGTHREVRVLELLKAALVQLYNTADILSQ